MARALPAVVVAAVLVGGCTSSGSSGRPASHSPAPTLTGSAPTAPTSSLSTSPVAASCSRSSTTLTYHRHEVVTAAYQLDLAPGSREASPKHLSPVTVVVARARGLGTGSGLVGLVSRRWHTMAASPGQSTRTLDPADTVTASDHRHQNEALVVYRTTHVFTGTFSGVCGGRKVHGRYTTFGPITTVLANCHGGHPGRLEKRARAVGCF